MPSGDTEEAAQVCASLVSALASVTTQSGVASQYACIASLLCHMHRAQLYPLLLFLLTSNYWKITEIIVLGPCTGPLFHLKKINIYLKIVQSPRSPIRYWSFAANRGYWNFQLPPMLGLCSLLLQVQVAHLLYLTEVSENIS